MGFGPLSREDRDKLSFCGLPGLDTECRRATPPLPPLPPPPPPPPLEEVMVADARAMTAA